VTVLNTKQQFSAYFLGVVFCVVSFLNDTIDQIATGHALQNNVGKIRLVVYIIQLDDMFAITCLLQGSNFVVQRNCIARVQILPSNTFGSKNFFCVPVYNLMDNRKCTDADLNMMGESRQR
jgi:hypothetical protein